MWVRSLGQKDALEEDMATHSSILAWTILWSEEPGGLQSVPGVAKSWTQLSDLAWMVNSMTREFEILWEPAKRFINCPRGIRECPKDRN